ncbi:TipAS antibiotic-recognition domain-containing protein [Kibdelosporangium persicum]|uniref:TipAS antibiotic-recognition domain-containing protein n=1 Tax=Kibdelosporangium persicum TaxID=2698649 RepID=UPI002483BEFC|nr:TipAS antibiotic-recognition domain-containing protein [Kibdelosporangium persicum]
MFSSACSRLVGSASSLLHYWQPTPEAYAAMGAMYRTDPRQRAMAEKADQALPDWLASAVEAYAVRQLRASRTRP